MRGLWFDSWASETGREKRREDGKGSGANGGVLEYYGSNSIAYLPMRMLQQLKRNEW